MPWLKRGRPDRGSPGPGYRAFKDFLYSGSTTTDPNRFLTHNRTSSTGRGGVQTTLLARPSDILRIGYERDGSPFVGIAEAATRGALPLSSSNRIPKAAVEVKRVIHAAMREELETIGHSPSNRQGDRAEYEASILRLPSLVWVSDRRNGTGASPRRLGLLFSDQAREGRLITLGGGLQISAARGLHPRLELVYGQRSAH